MLSKIVEINELGDERGYLSVLEGELTVPFEIKRVFYIYGTKKNVKRGHHAHYKTRQALISVSGECKVYLDNARRKETVLLNAPTKILLLEPNDWHEMYDFSENCVLLVLASHYYDAQDYIRDYTEFLKVYGNET